MSPGTGAYLSQLCPANQIILLMHLPVLSSEKLLLPGCSWNLRQVFFGVISILFINPALYYHPFLIFLRQYSTSFVYRWLEPQELYCAFLRVIS